MNYPTTIMTNSTMVCIFSINKKATKCICSSSTCLKVSGLKPDSSNPYIKFFCYNLIYFLIFQKQVNASNYVLSSDKYFIALESNYSKVIVLIYYSMKRLVSFSILLIVLTVDKCFLVLS